MSKGQRMLSTCENHHHLHQEADNLWTTCGYSRSSLPPATLVTGTNGKSTRISNSEAWAKVGARTTCNRVYSMHNRQRPATTRRWQRPLLPHQLRHQQPRHHQYGYQLHPTILRTNDKAQPMAPISRSTISLSLRLSLYLLPL